MAQLIEMPFGLRTLVGPWNHVFDGVKIPPWEGANIRGKGTTCCKVQQLSAVNFVKKNG